jgi:hypothetical protein
MFKIYIIHAASLFVSYVSFLCGCLYADMFKIYITCLHLTFHFCVVVCTLTCLKYTLNVGILHFVSVWLFVHCKRACILTCIKHTTHSWRLFLLLTCLIYIYIYIYICITFSRLVCILPCLQHTIQWASWFIFWFIQDAHYIQQASLYTDMFKIYITFRFSWLVCILSCIKHTLHSASWFIFSFIRNTHHI